MSAQVRPSPESPGFRLTPQLRTVLLTDLADSTALIERLGDVRAAAMLQRIDLRTRDLLEFTGGRLIDKSDGLLALFERPVRAVDFALRYQSLLQQVGAEEGISLKARIGIHVGELVTWENPVSAVAAGAKPLEVEGLAKPVAARLMGLAMPGQVLLSGMAQTLALRAQSELGDRADRLRWLMHGRYRFKGVPAPMLVHEVGEVGLSPLKAPASGQKAWREVPIWRRPPVLAVEALLLIGMISSSMYSLFKSPPALAFHERDWVVVGDMNNFTDDPRLEQSLDTALRVSLEQSQYVNLVPELKVESALERMRRAKTTTVDRATGSEIALREGARAVLLPSVAEVGGRLRVSVEVVDPSTQVTVYAQTAEGRGVDSALASLDRINVALRQKLGESLSDVRANSRPLAEVTTSNLDALRAYSLAESAFQQSRDADALVLYQRALALDPGFALAQIGEARVLNRSGDVAGAKSLALTAQANAERLTQREKLQLDAFVARFIGSREVAEKFRVWAELYPDSYYAYYGYALNALSINHFKDGAEFLAPALSDRSPVQGNAYYLQGALLLGLNRYAAAAEAFRQAEALGVNGRKLESAEVFAAQRRFTDAQRIVATQTNSGRAGADLLNSIDTPIFLLDEGRWDEARKSQDALSHAAEGVSPYRARGLQAGALLLAQYDGSLATASWRSFLDTAIVESRNAESPQRDSDAFQTLLGGWLAVRQGDLVQARRAMSAADAQSDAMHEPNNQSMRLIVQAELLMAEHKPEVAAKLLAERCDGTELFQAHAVLLRALAAAGDRAGALGQADWMSANRGRAYAEFNDWESLSAVNVLETDLALLSAAELALDSGQEGLARQRLRSFRAAWPRADQIGFVARRLRELEKRLNPTSTRKT